MKTIDKDRQTKYQITSYDKGPQGKERSKKKKTKKHANKQLSWENYDQNKYQWGNTKELNKSTKERHYKKKLYQLQNRV